MLTKAAIIVVTGIQAAGKSTVARLLAGRFERGVHVEADALQRMIVSGGEWVGEPGPPSVEAGRQLRLRLRNMCLLGKSFYDNGFSVVLDDIIIGERWDHLQEDLQGYPFTLVVLAPRVEVVQHWDTHRGKQPLGAAWAEYLDDELRKTMAGVGTWIDSSNQTPDQTVDAILASCLGA
ncbi:MAG: chloramphenicol phosphotransferase CPT family protein [Chloroflexota bacterium]|nr:chloramphenicol phosphotransferase CPT family protein [Chloroflexota bacterium]MDQ5865583.1 chloramphenicol phosphotransferase CPT family protein [Chloroflexota bacterium]